MMENLDYIITGYAVTGAAILGYRWLLAHRARRARELTAALTGRRQTAKAVRR